MPRRIQYIKKESLRPFNLFNPVSGGKIVEEYHLSQLDVRGSPVAVKKDFQRQSLEEAFRFPGTVFHS